MNRRRFFAGIGVTGVSFLGASIAHAQMPVFDPKMIEEITKGAIARAARVRLDLPVLADNGNSVTMKVAVQSAMTTADHVKTITLVSERNPVRNMATFYLGPRAGRAEIVSRLRLAGTQWVAAVAEMSDGTFFYAAERVVVTLSACVDES
jgi:sulfur-oxidizing protein SoxY